MNGNLSNVWNMGCVCVWVCVCECVSVTFRPLVKQTTTRNLYITIYIYFLDGRLCEVGAVRRGIRIVRRWGLNFSMSGDDGRDNAPSVTMREVSWTAGSFFLCLLLFNSSVLYYLQTPTQKYRHASTPTQPLPISSDRDVSLPSGAPPWMAFLAGSKGQNITWVCVCVCTFVFFKHLLIDFNDM